MRLFSLETVWREHGVQMVRSGSIGTRWHRIAVFAHIECREILLLIHFTPNCQFGSLQIRSVNAAPIGSNCTPYSNEGLGLFVSVISYPDWQLHAANYLSPPSPLPPPFSASTYFVEYYFPVGSSQEESQGTTNTAMEVARVASKKVRDGGENHEICVLFFFI